MDSDGQQLTAGAIKRLAVTQVFEREVLGQGQWAEGSELRHKQRPWHKQEHFLCEESVEENTSVCLES
jgi:hypothetical protein